jgi:hypothetical protein
MSELIVYSFSPCSCAFQDVGQLSDMFAQLLEHTAVCHPPFPPHFSRSQSLVFLPHITCLCPLPPSLSPRTLLPPDGQDQGRRIDTLEAHMEAAEAEARHGAIKMTQVCLALSVVRIYCMHIFVVDFRSVLYQSSHHRLLDFLPPLFPSLRLC